MSEFVVSRKALLLYADEAEAFKSGHQIDLLRSGAETFPAMLSAIARAEQFIHLETYLMRSDALGRRFAEALADRARKGVKVCVMFDSFGSLGIDPDFVEDLQRAGIQVRPYRPLVPWRRRWGLQRRDHRKVLVVDGQVAFTGGINFGNEYASVESGGGGWHDVHVRIRGPAVVALDRLFRRTWEKLESDTEDNLTLDEISSYAVQKTGNALARVLDNDEFRRRTAIRRAYVHAISQARDSISIVNAYFVPDIGIRWALRKACKRGVVVRIIVPARFDVAGVKHASRYLFSGLLDAGVRLFEWPGAMLHAKTMVVDALWATVGSYNLNYRSLLHDLEVGIAAIDPVLGTRMAEVFAEDVAKCHEITAAEWKRRPWWLKLMEWFFYRFKRWM